MGSQDFFHRKPSIIGEERFRKYAVLIPLMEEDGGIYVLFEKRSEKLRRQPGEICFPGGKLEAGETLMECAIRETVEELKVDRENIEILGPGDRYMSHFQLMIQPYIGILHGYEGTFSEDEVEEIIKVPVEYFFEQDPSVFQSRLIPELPEDFPYELIPGGQEYRWAFGSYDILFYQYKEWIIWGMTALMMKSAAGLMKEYHLTERGECEWNIIKNQKKN